MPRPKRNPDLPTGGYKVTATHSFYRDGSVTQETRDLPETYATEQEASAAITESLSRSYSLKECEIGRPKLSVEPINGG